MMGFEGLAGDQGRDLVQQGDKEERGDEETGSDVKDGGHREPEEERMNFGPTQIPGTPRPALCGTVQLKVSLTPALLLNFL